MIYLVVYSGSIMGYSYTTGFIQFNYRKRLTVKEYTDHRGIICVF